MENKNIAAGFERIKKDIDVVLTKLESKGYHRTHVIFISILGIVLIVSGVYSLFFLSYVGFVVSYILYVMFVYRQAQRRNTQ